MNPMDEAPKYRKIFEQLREEILSGRFAATERFPSEEQLVRRFRVSRNTVRSALEDLKRAGIIETRNGAKSVHMLIRPGSAPTVRQRAQGVREALLDLGLRWGQSSLLEFEPDDEKLVGRAFSRKVDAVVCGNDATAARLIGALGRIGRRVPQDILVAGVDDVRLSTLISPKLTTVRQPCEEIATAAVRTLLDRIRNPRQAAREIRLGGALVIRESSVRLSQAV